MVESQILILDDEEEWLYRHRGRLKDAGFNCYATQLAKEAIKSAKTNPAIKFALIDEILYVPPVPIDDKDKELQRWQGHGVVREITSQRTDIQIIIISSSPQIKSEEQGGNNQAFRHETVRLRRQPCVIDIIHKQDIKEDPEGTYAWIMDLLRKPQVPISAEVVKPRILIGLGFTKETHEAMAEQIGVKKKKFLPLSPFFKIGGARVLEDFLSKAKEKTVWLEMPGIKKPERLEGIKPTSSAFQILETLALRTEQKQEVVICEQDYQYSPRKTKKEVNEAPEYDPMSVRDFAFEYSEDGRRKSRTGVQIEGHFKKKSRLKVAIHRLSEKLAKSNLGAARQLFNYTLEHEGYQPNFKLGIVLYAVKVTQKNR